MTCNSPFINGTWADQAWKHWKGCNDKPKEESKRIKHHEPVSADLTNFKKYILKIRGMSEEEILRECGLI